MKDNVSSQTLTSSDDAHSHYFPLISISKATAARRSIPSTSFFGNINMHLMSHAVIIMNTSLKSEQHGPTPIFYLQISKCACEKPHNEAVSYFTTFSYHGKQRWQSGLLSELMLTNFKQRAWSGETQQKTLESILGKDGAGKVCHAEEPESENHPFAMRGKARYGQRENESRTSGSRSDMSR
jgi:hypothetical protein